MHHHPVSNNTLVVKCASSNRSVVHKIKPSIPPKQEPDPVESPVIAEVNATHSQEQESPSSEEDGEASGSAAFNPVTGEINWDCPCLGGMAHGVCGPQFREAFSCFVFSEKEPKGIDCVEKFKGMQDCFREHPDIYGAGQCRFVLLLAFVWR